MRRGSRGRRGRRTSYSFWLSRGLRARARRPKGSSASFKDAYRVVSRRALAEPALFRAGHLSLRKQGKREHKPLVALAPGWRAGAGTTIEMLL